MTDTTRDRNVMKIAAAIAVPGLFIMSYFLLRSVAEGQLASEAHQLFTLPWGMMALVDLYTGLVLFWGWILWRERSRWVAFGWLIALCLLGNLASCVYVIIALLRSNRCPQTFMHGYRLG